MTDAVRPAPAPDDPLATRLERCYSGVVHDVMRDMGFSHFTLPPEIRPILPEKRLAGPIYTLRGHIEPTADPHETLLAWTGFLSEARPGHVVLSQPNDRTIAHMGELSAETLQLRGIRGYVTDGGCRDVEFLLKLGFPVFCRYFTPRDVVGLWMPDGQDVPIRIGTVTVRPGDYACGDRDGVCIIPGEHVEEVIDKAESAITTENKVRTAILQGTDPREAYLKYGKF